MQKPPLGITARCRVARVLDGDTLDVELRIPARIRLLSCWASESRTKDAEQKLKGLAAKQHLKDLAANGLGRVFIPTEEARSMSDVLTLERLLGRVWLDGDEQDLSERQVAAGHAITTKGGPPGT